MSGINLKLLTRHETYDLAVRLQIASEFHSLTAAQSWDPMANLTPVQFAQYKASVALFELANLMKE